MNKSTAKLLNYIISLSGDKIVTITLSDEEYKSFDLDKNGIIGYRPSHISMFNSYLMDCQNNGGVVMVRQFTKIQSHILEDGTEIPYKNIYGFISRDRLFTPIDSRTLESSMLISPKTNEPRDPEKGALYRFADNYSNFTRNIFSYSISNVNHVMRNIDIPIEDWDDTPILSRENIFLVESIILIDIPGWKYKNNTVIDLCIGVMQDYTRWMLSDELEYLIDGESDVDEIEEDDRSFVDGTLETWLERAITGEKIFCEDCEKGYYLEAFGDKVHSDIRDIHATLLSNLAEIADPMDNIEDDILENEWRIYNQLCKLDAKAVFFTFADSIVTEMIKKDRPLLDVISKR